MRLLLICALIFNVASLQAEEHKPWQHYYFLKKELSVNSTEKPSYVPLVITSDPIENRPEQQEFDALVIITYQRDSIWEFREDPQKMQRLEKVKDLTRISLEGKTYVLEEAKAETVLRLLLNPYGTIPLHRRESPITKAPFWLKTQLEAIERLRERSLIKRSGIKENGP